MRSFSQYCRASYITIDATTSKATMATYVKAWLDECQNDFAWTLTGAAGQWTQLRTTLTSYLNKPVITDARSITNLADGHWKSNFVPKANEILNRSPFPKPAAPFNKHDHDRGGIAVAAYPVTREGASAKWANVYGYSNDHADFTKRAQTGMCNSAATLVQLKSCTKSSILDRPHGEDDWFLFHFDSFVQDVKLLTPGMDNDLAGQHIQEQRNITPRIEFIQSAMPCMRAATDAQSGCALYYKPLRDAVGDRIPIVIYSFKIWGDYSEPANSVSYVDKDGSIVLSECTWNPDS